MGLEGTDDPLMPQTLGRVQQHLQFAGVVSVVITHLCPVVVPLVLKAASRQTEVPHALLHGPAGNPQHGGGGRGRQHVFHVVHAGNGQLHVGIHLIPVHHVEGGKAVVHLQVLGVHVALLHTEGNHRTGLPLQRLHGVGILTVGHDVPAVRHQISKGPEGVLHVLQVLEEVQVVRLNVQNHRHRGTEGEEGVAVLAGLQNDGVTLAHPVSSLQQGQRAANHHRGVQLGGHEDVGADGGGGGLAVGAGDAQGVLIPCHDGAPGLGPLEHGDASGQSGGDLRVVVVYGGGAHHAVRPLHTLRQMANGHRDAQAAQMCHGGALLPIGTRDDDSVAQQHLRQRGHGDTANAHQMGPLSRFDILMDVID